MKRSAPFLLLAIALFLQISSRGQNPVNGYAQVTAIAGNTLTVTNVNEAYDTFEDGEEVIVMQMQDNVAGTNTANNSTFGDISGIGNAGRWEIRVIASHTESLGVPATVTLTTAMAYPYSTCAQCRVQLITRPTFGAPNWTTTAPINALAWNGSIGGVVAFRVPGTLTVGHDILANGRGFRGGAPSANFTGACNANVYTSASTNYGEKGEGIQFVNTAAVRYARNKLINGGGGGSTNNAGGGGGGHVTQGGNAGGGYNCVTNAGGTGGLIIFPYVSFSRYFMGGGGGGGQANNSAGGAGGAGGGIILIKANTLQTLPGASCPFSIARIMASGLDGGNSVGLTPDGAGGGGAGGTVYLDVALLDVDPACPLICAANGGNGGSVVNTNPSPGNWVDTGGAGGGGGQGMVACGAAVAPGGNATTSTQSGVGGVNDPANGRAQTGSGMPNSGVQGFGGTITLPIELLFFSAKPEGQTVQLAWATVSEENNRLFRVQRSVDLERWTTVTERTGAGWSSSMQEYSAVDLFPLAGTSYYRLEQEDADGARTYSNIAPVDFAGRAIPLAFPQPADAEISLVGPNAASLTFSMFDLAGREVAVRSEKREDRITLDTRSLSSGTYLVRWSSVDGTSGSMPVVVAH